MKLLACLGLVIMCMATVPAAHAQSLSETVSGSYASKSAAVSKKAVKKRAAKRRSAKRRGHKSRKGYTASMACVVPELRQLIGEITAKFGPVKVISTCRPGAVIRGTNKPSLHRYGRAVDFVSPLKGQVVQWLRVNWRGGVMTYRNHRHIHVDVGRGKFVRLGAWG